MFVRLGKRLPKVLMVTALLMSFWGGSAYAQLSPDDPDYALQLFGKYLFFDTHLAEPSTQGCVTCHDPKVGGKPKKSDFNADGVAIPGADRHTAGNIATPTNTYATLVPDFHQCGLGAPQFGGFCGGNFFNGRATGSNPADLNQDIDTSQLVVQPRGADFAGQNSTPQIGEEIFDGTGTAYERYRQYLSATSDQALNPILEGVEQNLGWENACLHIAASDYAPIYEEAWGEPIDCSSEPVMVNAVAYPEYEISIKRAAVAMGAYQDSPDINSFSSKRDLALRTELACLDDDADGDPTTGMHAAYYDAAVCAAADEMMASEPEGQLGAKTAYGKFPLVLFTYYENLGHDVFYNFKPLFGPPGRFDIPAAQCSFCHLSEGAFDVVFGGTEGDADGTALTETYGDSSYHNIGGPKNPEIPGPAREGVSAHLGFGPAGGFRAVTLRNVAKVPDDPDFVKNYTHNGWFKSLESLVHFYNTSFLGTCWVETEIIGFDQCEDLDNPPIGGGPPGAPKAYEFTTAAAYGITRCDPALEWTEEQAVAANCWPEAEWPGAASFLVGDLGMMPGTDYEAALVAYMRTLTDEHTATKPDPYKDKNTKDKKK